MKFDTLKVQNFLTLRNAEVSLLDRGLHLIQGANDDDTSATSNGAGKSSLVDAICWCLFGRTARDVKGDAVVNLGAKKDCMVYLDLINGASVYRVARYRKHGTMKNALVLQLKGSDPSIMPTDLSRGTDAETQKVLEQILGCSYEVFMAAVYSGQEAMPDLPRMKDREIKQLVEEAAGLQRIEKAYEVARERGNTAKSAVEALQSRADTRAADIERAKMSLETVEDKHAGWELGRAARIEAVNARISEEQTACDAVSGLIFTLDVPALESKTRLIAIDEKMGAHRALSDAAATADSAVRVAELAIDKRGLIQLGDLVKLHEGQIANAADEVRKPCTECGTILESMPVAEYIAHRTTHLTEAKAKLEAVKTKIRAQLVELAALKTKAATARAAVPDVSALLAERALAQAKIKEHDEALASHGRKKESLRSLHDTAALRKSEVNPDESALELARTRVTEAAASHASTLVELEAAKGKFAIAAAVVKVFGPAGVRAQILDTVTPYLNDRTADYLSAMSDGEITAVWTTLTKSSAGELKEKFSIDVDHKKGGESFAALSGGEKRKVRLATALALQDLVASRATQPIDLWIGDEIDDALDAAGLERLMTILERKARERGTVLVISHSDLRDWVDEVTIVRKTGLWNSTVEGSLCS